jgi:hypothetical protein
MANCCSRCLRIFGCMCELMITPDGSTARKIFPRSVCSPGVPPHENFSFCGYWPVDLRDGRRRMAQLAPGCAEESGPPTCSHLSRGLRSSRFRPKSCKSLRACFGNLWLKVRIDGKEAGCTPKSISVSSVARGLVENKSDWKSPRALA